VLPDPCSIAGLWERQSPFLPVVTADGALKRTGTCERRSTPYLLGRCCDIDRTHIERDVAIMRHGLRAFVPTLEPAGHFPSGLARFQVLASQVCWPPLVVGESLLVMGALRALRTERELA
jgi:hypothetical protein